MIKITKNNLKNAYLQSLSKSTVNEVGLTALKKEYFYAENPFLYMRRQPYGTCTQTS